MNPTIYREATGLTIEKAAKKARVSVAYLKRVERNGFPPPCLSSRLSRLYAMSENEWYRLENFGSSVRAKARAKADEEAAIKAATKAARAAQTQTSATPKGRRTAAQDHHHAPRPVSTPSGIVGSAAWGS